MKEVNIGYCCEDVFDFIVQCKNMTRLLAFTIQDSNSDRDIVTGLIRVLPRLNKLKQIDIWDVNMGSEGSNVISSVNSLDLRIFTLQSTSSVRGWVIIDISSSSIPPSVLFTSV